MPEKADFEVMIRIRYIMEYLSIRPFDGVLQHISRETEPRRQSQPATRVRETASVWRLAWPRSAAQGPSVSKLDREAIVGRLDVRRQSPAELVVVEV